MGFENLYRQGAGEATVLNFGNVVNTYAQQLAMDNQRRQKEREAYAKELEGVEWTSRNPEEEKYFRDKWESVLERNHQRSQSNNPQEKMKLSSEINMIKKQMLSDGKRLKEEIDLDQKIAAIPLSKDEDEMPDNFGKLLQERRATSIFNPNFKNYGTEAFSAKPKVFDINADIMSNANIAATEVSEEFTVGSGLDARRAYREGKRLDENKFKELILNRIATNPAARRAYLKGAEPTPENLELAATAAYEAVKDKFSLKSREGNYIDPSGRQLSLAESTAKINAKYRPAKDGDDDNSYTMIDMVLPYGDGASFSTNQYIPISIPEKNFAGSSYIDMKTGKPGTKKLSSSGDYEMVGVVNMPMIKRGEGDWKDGLEGAIAQPNFEKNNPGMVEYVPMIHVQKPTGAGGFKYDYLIPYNRMPENVKSTKAIKNALSNFKPGARPSGETQPAKVDIKSLRDKYNY